MQNDAPPDDGEPQKPENEQDDFELFRQQMQGVKPLPAQNKIRRQHPARPPRVRQPEQTRAENAGFAIRDDAADAPDILNFARSGVQTSTLKKLRQGKLTIDKHIDLHGLTAEQARDYLFDVLEECQSDGTRVILMVHGKGYRSKHNKPVIKTQLNLWLRECEQVLAFHSAQPKDGGSGAVYVLLRKMG